MTATILWAVKGGSGTTVVAACHALANPAPTLLLDLDGDLPAVLGVAEPSGQGLVDWFATDLPAFAVDTLAVPLDATTRLVPLGVGRLPQRSDRWAELASWLAASAIDVIVDAGTGPLPDNLVQSGADIRFTLVTRACYLALRRATQLTPRPDGVVLVDELGRGLRQRDIEHVIGAPVIATISVDPMVARAVDAGLLRQRLPKMASKLLKASA